MLFDAAVAGRCHYVSIDIASSPGEDADAVLEGILRYK
jgi:hypothetical protein